MKNKYLYWLPRTLATIFILFISLLAIDVFGEYSFPKVLLALFIHLIPSFVLVGILWLAWKKELFGGILFLLLGIVPLIFFNEPLEAFLTLSLPILIVGILFLVNSYINKKK